MGNGEPGPLGGHAVPLVEEEVKLGAEFAIIQRQILEELHVRDQHLKSKTVPPKIAQLVS